MPPLARGRGIKPYRRQTFPIISVVTQVGGCIPCGARADLELPAHRSEGLRESPSMPPPTPPTTISTIHRASIPLSYQLMFTICVLHRKKTLYKSKLSENKSSEGEKP